MDTVEELHTLHQSPPENIFSMDKVGINQGISPCQIVIVGKGKRVQYQAKNAEKENMTVLETICTDRTTLKPMVIFKGTYIMAKWGKDNPNDARRRPMLKIESMAPAKANAQHADFVVVLPTPVHAIVSAHQKYLEQEERSDDGDGNDSPAVPISPIDLHPVLHNTSAAFLVSQDSSSPTKQLPATVFNTVPSSFEPTYSMTNHPHQGGCTLTYHEMEKRVQMMEVKLQKAKDVIAKQRAVNVGANAQLFLQDLHLKQLQQENFELKKPKKSSAQRKLMSTKMAQHLTGEAFREALRLMAEEDVVKAAQKKVNEIERDRSKLQKEWQAQEHEMRKATQQEALAAWEEEKAEATC
ncbi:hypothetical protein FRB96_003849 [Tulasnella sp. 330]|nr:hypothetical protein FRB96_003849 [Tulasnella sp. 330]